MDHEVNVRPINTPQYRKLLADRRLESEQSKKPIVVITSDMMSQGKLNQMASGFSNASSTLGKGMISGSGKVPGERHARLDKNELTDRLFQLFSERPYWSIAALKARLQQPDMWLREVLKDVAEVITGGHYANMWQLKEDWKGNGEGEAKAEADGDDDDDDEDEDESDLEEVQLIE